MLQGVSLQEAENDKLGAVNFQNEQEYKSLFNNDILYLFYTILFVKCNPTIIGG